MATVVEHKVAVTSRYPYDVVQDLHGLMAARAEFTIVEAHVSGANDDWFVFKMTGGTWECWLGGTVGYPSWHADNMNVSITDDYVCTAFAPGGGWDVGSDDPDVSGAMFSNAPAGSGGWSKICKTFENGSAWEDASYTRDMTFIRDNADPNFLVWASDRGQLGTWSTLLWFGEITESRLETDLYPYCLLTGNMSVDSSSGIAVQSTILVGTDLLNGSAVLDPTYTGGGQPAGRIACEASYYSSLWYLPTNLQSGEHEWRQLQLANLLTPHQHMRGGVDTDKLRLVSSKVAHRQLLAGGTWIAAHTIVNSSTAAGFVVPWLPAVTP